MMHSTTDRTHRSGPPTRPRRTTRASLALLAALAGAGLLSLPPAPASAATTTIAITGRVSTGTGGGQIPGGVYDDPKIDGTGRYVFFGSADAVVAGDTNGKIDVYRKDRLTGRTERVSVLGDADQIPSGGRLCAVTPNGRYVVFQAGTTGSAGPINRQLLRRDLVAGSTVVVSQNQGNVADQGADGAGCDVSDDGQRIVFASDSTNLGGDSPGQVYLRRLDSGSTTVVSRSTAGVSGNGVSFQAQISADGGVIAFGSDATNLVASDTNGERDIFVRLLASNTTERVSTAAGGQQATGDSQVPSISSNGRYVAFRSQAADLVADDENGAADVFRKDRQTSAIVRASIAYNGNEANGPSTSPSMTPDGRYIAFGSGATNLYPADPNGQADIFRRDLTGGTTDLVSRRWDTIAPGNEMALYTPAISTDGRVVAFMSEATDLVPNDTNGAWDIFVRDVAVDLAPFGSAKAFAQQQLADFAPPNAYPAPPAVDSTSKLLRWGSVSPDGLIVQQARSTSWTAKRSPLIRLYWAFFLRAPDPSGMTYWTNQLTNGTTLAQVAAKFAQSSEFQTKYGSKTNEQFVTLIYQNIFERDPDPDGLAYWTGKLDTKAKTRGDVMTSFSESSEGRRFLTPQVDTVNIWLGMLRTMPPKAELAQWIADIRSGAKVAEQVATKIRTLPAYAARVTV